MDTVHFHSASHGGFGEVKGIARLEAAGIELQFSTRVLGVIKSGLRNLSIPLEALSAARYASGFLWLNPSIELRVRDLSLLSGMPDAEDGRIVLRVKLRDRRAAALFVSELEGMSAQHRMSLLDRSLERLAGASRDPGGVPEMPGESQPAPARTTESAG